LAPIELFMETEDRPEHPMTFVIELRLSGSIDRDAFTTSLSAALHRHPFLSALVKRRKKNQLCWVAAKELTPRVDWSDDDRPLELPPEGEAIDLDSEIGLRIWVRRHAGEAKITLQFHHACCDGVGAYRFIGDLLAIYGDLTTADGAERPTLAPLDVTRLRTRSRGVLDVALSGQKFRLARLSVREGLEIVTARATELAPAQKESGRRLSPFPSVQSVTFERSAHDQLRDAAMQHGAMLNDLLLAELFLAARDWNVRKTGAQGRKYRIMMPTDLRTTDDYETPAVNKVAYTFLNRTPRELERPEELLQSLRRETIEIKNERRGVRFADMLAGGFAVKGLMPLMLSFPFCMATAILSNVGDPSRRFTARFPRNKGRIVCGNLILEEIIGAPPLRRKTRATISAFAYNRRLTLSARCDPFTFTPADTQEFLDLYAARLQSHVAAPKAVPGPELAAV
jgi:hypothetical protein